MFDSKFVNDAWIQCKLKKLNYHANIILHEQAANVGILARFYYFHLVPLLLQASLLLFLSFFKSCSFTFVIPTLFSFC